MVQSDLNEIYNETNSDSELISLRQFFTLKDLRGPLITSLVLQIAQQLSGINAIFFYSSQIFKDAGIEEDLIQYAILLTGLVNLITTIFCVPLIDKLGRKPLLVIPMITMVIDFILLVIFLALQVNSILFY